MNFFRWHSLYVQSCWLPTRLFILNNPVYIYKKPHFLRADTYLYDNAEDYYNDLPQQLKEV